MTTVHFDPAISDDKRRELLYRGDLFVYSPIPAALELTEFAKAMVKKAFGNHDPEFAQFEMSVGDFAKLLADLKPKFIHHPECKRLLPLILETLGCDPERTYFDVPRLRTSTSDSYLTTGIAYAFHPHRDTWYSAPICQVNWWIPVLPVTTENSMAFHPRYWNKGVRNSSNVYNYQEWNEKSRFNAASQVGEDTRPQPHPLEPVELEPDIRLIPPVGGAIVFSAAQLHSSVPNTSGRTRFSLDFRTVNLDDARNVRGAHNVDSSCTGSTMHDYIRCKDFEHLPEDAMAPYAAGPPPMQFVG